MMKKIFNIIKISSIPFLLPFISFAQGIENPLKSNPHTVEEVFNIVMPYVNSVAAMIATLAFVYNGFLFAKARGNEKELGVAKQFFQGTIIGILIIFGANIIVGIVNATIASLH